MKLDKYQEKPKSHVKQNRVAKRIDLKNQQVYSWKTERSLDICFGRNFNKVLCSLHERR